MEGLKPESTHEGAAEGVTLVSLQRVERSGRTSHVERNLVLEAPVAIEIDGIGYAVLMATPVEVADLATGFVLAERLVDGFGDVLEIDVHEHADGIIARLALAPRVAGRTADRVRHRFSESACGLCGVENLEQAMRPLPKVLDPFRGSPSAVFVASEAIRDRQSLNNATGAVHAAALCGPDGDVRLIREDVGRHNAFDKLIGAMLREGLGWDSGFALLTSRCSYELVEKAVVSGCPMLATISAPTSLALSRAKQAGLPLITLARADALLFAP